MPITITREITLYQFSELSEKAKDKAREWLRECNAGDDFYAEIVIDDAADMADILGIDLRQTRKNLMDGSYRYDPTIFYSGFWSQGDGACFEGTYRYKKGAAKAMGEATSDKELIRIAKELQRIQSRYFYALTARTKHSGHYYHSGCMRVEVDYQRDDARDISDAETDIKECMRDFANWIYSQLETEYEWRNEDAQIDDDIEANEYTFDIYGNRKD